MEQQTITPELKQEITDLAWLMQEYQWKDSGLQKTFEDNWERAGEENRAKFLPDIKTAVDYVAYVKRGDVTKNEKLLAAFALEVLDHKINLSNFTIQTPFRLRLFNSMTKQVVKKTNKAMTEAAKIWNSK